MAAVCFKTRAVAPVLAVVLAALLLGSAHGCNFYCSKISSFPWVSSEYRVEVSVDGGSLAYTKPDFSSMGECNRHVCDCWSAKPTLAKCSVLRSWDNFKEDLSCSTEVRPALVRAGLHASSGHRRCGACRSGVMALACAPCQHCV